MPDEKNIIRCTGCRKVIGEGTLNDGKISIKCKCGVLNTIEATPKPQPKQETTIPFQDRLNLVKKEEKETFEIKRLT